MTYLLFLFIVVLGIIIVILWGQVSELQRQVRGIQQQVAKMVKQAKQEEEEKKPTPVPTAAPTPVPRPTNSVQKPSLPPPQKSHSRMEWEMLIGGKLLNRIGALALVIGLGLFIKYAFDHDWINEVARVVGGAAVGFLLLWGGAYAHRKQLAIFGQGLLGAGVATLYISAFASYNFYQLVPFQVAFLLMVAVTGIAFQQALRYDSLAISVLGLFGGFLTPFLLHTDHPNLIRLFIYIALLTIGLLAVVWKKERWTILYYLALVGVYTTYFISMVGQHVTQQLWVYISFLVLFWALFYAYELYSNLRTTRWSEARTMSATAHTVLLFIGWRVLLGADYHYGYLGAVLLSGLAYLAPLVIWKLRKRLDTVNVWEKGRYGFTFLTLLVVACAIEWTKYPLLGAWTVLAFLIVGWGIWQRVQSAVWYGIALYAVTSVSLIIFSSAFSDVQTGVIPFWNARGWVYLGISLALFINAIQVRRLAKAENAPKYLNWMWLWLGGTTMLAIACVFEWTQYALLGAWTVLAFLTVSLGIWQRVRGVVWYGVALYVVIGLRLLIASTDDSLANVIPFWNERAWVYLGIVIALIINTIHLRRQTGQPAPLFKGVSSTLHVTWMLLLLNGITTDINLYFDQLMPNNYTEQAIQLGYQRRMVISLAWLVYSFLLMVIGIWRRLLVLRVVAIGLFFISILKVFLFDLSFLTTVYRMISFMGLGIILLAVSYMYQKYKHFFHG